MVYQGLDEYSTQPLVDHQESATKVNGKYNTYSIASLTAYIKSSLLSFFSYDENQSK